MSQTTDVPSLLPTLQGRSIVSQVSSLTLHVSAAVVIVCHNYGRFLAEAIESVLAQTLPATEVVAVLDHCSDNSHEVARRYPVEALETHACDPHLARRLGVRSTRSEVLIFLDADDWISENYIADGLPCFDDPHVGIVTGDIQRFGYDSSHVRASLGDIEAQNCVTSAALVRREAIDQSQCFEDFSLVGVPSEDWETWKRIVRAGWKIATPATPITHHHRRHGANRTLSRLFQDDPWCRSQRGIAGEVGRMIKIGYVSPSAGLGGAETQIVSQMGHARRLEWIGAWVPEGGPRNPEILGRLPPLHTGEEGLARICRDADAIYAWGLPALPARIRRLTDAPILYGVHGEGEWTRESLVNVGEAVDILLCVSHGAVRTIPRRHRNKARLIRGGADLRAAITHRNRVEIRREWGIAPGELVVGYVGRLSVEKNPVVIAQAVTLIPGARLVVCSPQAAEHANPIRREIAEELGDRVVWTSSAVLPMGEVYRGLDCLVVASHEEGMPTVTLEAWLAGVPVVSTPVGLIQELEPRHGPLVERTPLNPTPREIATAIGKAVAPNPLRTETARELVLYRLSMQRMALEFEELVEEVTRKRVQCSGFRFQEETGPAIRDSPQASHRGDLNPESLKPFVIRTMPRTGTYMLKTALDSHPELTCHGAMFHPQGTQYRYQDKTTDYVYRKYTGLGEGLIIHGLLPGDSIQYPFTEDVWPLIARERPVLIVLSRRDHLRRCASLARAIQTNTWSITQPGGPGAAVTIRPWQVRLWIDRAIESQRTARRLFPWAIFLDYEDLVADWDRQIARIQRAIGVREVLPLQPTIHRQSSDSPVRELVANFDELREEFRGTDYERWFVLAEQPVKQAAIARRGIGGRGGRHTRLTE